ncbi:TPA: hypothetical protein MYQ04_004239 [Citrobacter braakii]|uniref:Bacteriophage protein n=1 Tax=Escherichia coli TaxID=562 RepID=A0A7U5TGZ2_ECOLX|nr:MULTISPECIES: hypothetical protein [Enterobacteriaceae]AUY01017.1 hypothetical protein C3F40_03810 [Escherichia coli]HCB1742880.1 hypothetical protein [Citrobacter braakii]HEE0093326.1 hypothetical protein [Citrobacter braakii]HEE9916479.1 hypothetical protein [Citrobacter braakii]
MKVTTRKKPAFRDFYEMGMFVRVVATRTEEGKWRLFGIHRSADAAIFIEAARGGVREWSDLGHLGAFCDSMGVSLWEVHHKMAGQKKKAA